jgi:hypothetical protein
MSMEKLHQVLTEIASSSTFTPQALSQFQTALERAKQLENAYENVIKEKDGVTRLAEACKKEIADWKKREDGLKAREDAVTKREVEITKLETRAAVAEAKEAVRKEVFDVIFKNTVVRRQSMDAVSGSINGGGTYSNTSNTHTIDETTTEE